MIDDDCLHGMPPLSCSICLHGTSKKKGIEIEYVFTAKFDGQCTECNLPTVKGTQVAKLSNGRYVHAKDCALGAVRPATRST